MRYHGSLAALLAAALAAGADDPVTLTWPDPPRRAGERVRVTETEKSKTATEMAVPLLGKREAWTEEGERSVVYVEEIVTPAGKDGGRPLKLKRTYEKYEAASAGEVEAGPPLNVTLVIEKKGDRYAFDAGAEKLDPTFAARLDKEFNTASRGGGGAALLPGRPVRPGDTWTIDPKKAFESLPLGQFATDPAAVRIEGRLLKVHRKKGRPFAVAEWAIKSPIDALAGKDGTVAGLEVQDGSAATVTVTLDLPTDGTTRDSGMTFAARVRVVLAGGGVSASVEVESTSTTTQEVLRE